MEVIDPRLKDKNGNSGLSRYVLGLRKESPGDIIDLGIIKIMTKETGTIYENGLLINQEGVQTAFGYDFPEIVKTRERNTLDMQRLVSYLQFVFSECRDVRYISGLIKEFKGKYLEESIKDLSGASIEELDLDIGRLLWFGVNPMSIVSKPLWKSVFQKELPGYYFYNQSSFKHIANSPNSEEEEKQKAQMVLANIRHIPKDRLINVEHYDDWAIIAPTAEDYVMSLASQEVPADDKDLSSLRKLASSKAQFINRAVKNLQSSPEGNRLINSLLTKQKPSKQKQDDLAKSLSNLNKEIAYWSDPDTLEQNKDAVFITPKDAPYLGTVNKNRIGLNEDLLNPDRFKELSEVTIHELLHKVSGLSDYSPEFIALILEMAYANMPSNQTPNSSLNTQVSETA
jgi:hypothetical protein